MEDPHPSSAPSINTIRSARGLDVGIDGRTALVTGATSGLGAEMARVLARAGARVAVAGRNAQRGENVVSEITAAGGEARFFPHEAAEIDGAQELADAVERALGPLEILVNNAGAMFFGPLAQLGADDFERALAINLRGPFLLTRAIVPAMAERGHGRVIFISSNGASSGAAMTSLYAMGKSGLEGLMRALTAEFGSRGVTFNTVEPGLVDTPLTATMLSDETTRKQLAGHHPNRRVGEPADVALAVKMLADDDARHMLANVIIVDGGLTRTIGYAVVEPPEEKRQ
jgi:NAD(P)-dependent dehydrogenase (short-subunit alcohol dehydrogenase family)